jgi:hypothetical protein
MHALPTIFCYNNVQLISIHLRVVIGHIGRLNQLFNLDKVIIQFIGCLPSDGTSFLLMESLRITDGTSFLFLEKLHRCLQQCDKQNISRWFLSAMRT